MCQHCASIPWGLEDPATRPPLSSVAKPVNHDGVASKGLMHALRFTKENNTIPLIILMRQGKEPNYIPRALSNPAYDLLEEANPFELSMCARVVLVASIFRATGVRYASYKGMMVALPQDHPGLVPLLALPRPHTMVVAVKNNTSTGVVVPWMVRPAVVESLLKAKAHVDAATKA